MMLFIFTVNIKQINNKMLNKTGIENRKKEKDFF